VMLSLDEGMMTFLEACFLSTIHCTLPSFLGLILVLGPCEMEEEELEEGNDDEEGVSMVLLLLGRTRFLFPPR